MTKTIDYYNKKAQQFIEGTVSVDFTAVQNMFPELFYGILERNIWPMYDSAKRQGYKVWMV